MPLQRGIILVFLGLSAVVGIAGFIALNQLQQTTQLKQINAEFGEKISSLTSSVEAKDKQIAKLQGDNSGLVDEKSKLETQVKSLDRTIEDYKNQVNNGRILIESMNSQLSNTQNELSTVSDKYNSANAELSKFGSQTGEIVFYRQMQIHNYKNGFTYPFYWNIPFKTYAYYRENPNGHFIPSINDEKSVEYYKTALNTSSMVKPLADLIRGYSGSDDELYANMALQLTHQFYYSVTDNTKYPIETFVEGSGDCDTLSTFQAALLKEGGLDTIIMIGYAKGSQEETIGSGHAMVGVALDSPPDDQNRGSYSYYDYQGKRYYLVESTWGNPFKSVWDYTLMGSAVGDNPWAEFKVTNVAHA